MTDEQLTEYNKVLSFFNEDPDKHKALQSMYSKKSDQEDLYDPEIRLIIDQLPDIPTGGPKKALDEATEEVIMFDLKTQFLINALDDAKREKYLDQK